MKYNVHSHSDSLRSMECVCGGGGNGGGGSVGEVRRGTMTIIVNFLYNLINSPNHIASKLREPPCTHTPVWPWPRAHTHTQHCVSS